MLSCQHLCKKLQICVSEPHFGEVRGNARPWLMARWKAHGQLSICVKELFFAICYDSGVKRQNVFSSAVFAGGSTSLHSILPGRPPLVILGVRKLETLGYLMVKTAPLCVSSF